MGRAWHVWIHPKRTVAELEELEDSLCDEAQCQADLRTEIEKLQAEIAKGCEEHEALKGEYADMSERRDKLNATVMELTRTLMETRIKLDDSKKELAVANQKLEDLQHELDERVKDLEDFKEIEKRMPEFEQALGQAEEMKRRYEARIAKLRDRVAELQKEQEAQHSRENDGNWLESLPV